MDHRYRRDVLGRMDIGKHPVFDSIRPYPAGSIVTYGGEVWRAVAPFVPLSWPPPPGSDGIVHVPSDTDPRWENISSRNESDFQSSPSSANPSPPRLTTAPFRPTPADLAAVTAPSRRWLAWLIGGVAVVVTAFGLALRRVRG